FYYGVSLYSVLRTDSPYSTHRNGQPLSCLSHPMNLASATPTAPRSHSPDSDSTSTRRPPTASTPPSWPPTTTPTAHRTPSSPTSRESSTSSTRFGRRRGHSARPRRILPRARRR